MANDKKKACQSALCALLVMALCGCSDGTDSTTANDNYKPEGMRQAVEDQDTNVSNPQAPENSAYASGEQGQTEALPATAHRTVRFTGDSTELDANARQSLESLADALNGDLSTVVVVRTVDPNDVSAGEPDPRSQQRIEAVELFLQQQGIQIAQLRADRYSSREFESSKNSEDVQEDMQATSGLSELEETEPTEISQQEVVVTIVSSEQL